MDQLPPIPVPREHRWREFRINQIPILIFGVALVAVVIIWKQHVSAPGFVGEVETVRANVISTLPGLLTELTVDRFDKVSKGQAIGKVYPADPELLKASLAAIAIDLKTLQVRMDLDKDRNELNFEQLRMDWLNQRVELATAKMVLNLAETEFQRNVPLHDEKIISESVFDFVKAARDGRAEEVREKSKVISEMEAHIKQIESTTKQNKSSGTDETFKKAIAAQEAQLLLTEGPITLKSPIDGVVNTVNFRSGERVMAGLPIISIVSPQASRIISFARQPFRVLPKVGDRVEIRTRSTPRKMAMASVLSVGSEVENMVVPQNNKGNYPNALGNPLERGLSFSVSLPNGLPIYPGETVDLVIVR